MTARRGLPLLSRDGEGWLRDWEGRLSRQERQICGRERLGNNLQFRDLSRQINHFYVEVEFYFSVCSRNGGSPDLDAMPTRAEPIDEGHEIPVATDNDKLLSRWAE